VDGGFIGSGKDIIWKDGERGDHVIRLIVQDPENDRTSVQINVTLRHPDPAPSEIDLSYYLIRGTVLMLALVLIPFWIWWVHQRRRRQMWLSGTLIERNGDR
jgi:hypothetical protein